MPRSRNADKNSVNFSERLQRMTLGHVSWLLFASNDFAMSTSAEGSALRHVRGGNALGHVSDLLPLIC
eukprot:3707123-Rhodomonas_salina.1